ncbi:MAG: helix-turn-helix domain-containing protein [Bacteroidota bacterium]
MEFSMLDLVVLFGLMLSIFLVLLIVVSKSFRSDVHLYFALAVVSLNLSLAVTWFENSVPENGIMEIISWPYLFPAAYFVYFLKSIKHPVAKNKLIWLVLLPCVVLSIFQITDFILDVDIIDWLANENDERYEMIIELIGFLMIPYSLALIGYSYFRIRKSQGLFPKEKKWLLFNSLSILVFLVIWLFSDLISEVLEFELWEYVLAALGMFLAVTTYQGVHQLNIFEQRRQLSEIGGRKPGTTNGSSNATDRTPKKQQKKIEKIKSLMIDEKLYLNPDLSRYLIAEKLDLSEGYLSELINNSLNTNFNDYINDFRVQHAIEMFQDRNYDVFSIEAIGHDSGFKTKSVFYSAFKKVTNKTPGAYRKSLNLS